MVSLKFGRTAASFILLSSVVACDDAGTTRTKHRVEGRVDDSATYQGASCDASEVDDDGHPVAESEPDAPTTVDAQGNFSLEVNVRTGVRADVIVEALTAAERRAVIVTSDFAGSATVIAEPMTAETTLESNVYASLLESGQLCTGCTTASVQDWLGASAAAEVDGSLSSDASIAAIASAIAEATASYEAVLEASASSRASLDAAFEAHAEARETRAVALHQANGAAAVDAAESAYVEMTADAYAQAGLSYEEVATAAHAAAEAGSASVRGNLLLGANLSAALLADIEGERAMFVTTVVEANAAASGASSTALASAGATLRASIEAAAAEGFAAEASIEAAWNAYRTSVQAELRASVNVAQQSAFDSTASAIASASASFDATYESSIAVATSAFALVAPMLDFSTNTSVHVDALVGAGTSLDQASAIVDVLVCIGLAAG